MGKNFQRTIDLLPSSIAFNSAMYTAVLIEATSLEAKIACNSQLKRVPCAHLSVGRVSPS